MQLTNKLLSYSKPVFQINLMRNKTACRENSSITYDKTLFTDTHPAANVRLAGDDKSKPRKA